MQKNRGWIKPIPEWRNSIGLFNWIFCYISRSKFHNRHVLCTYEELYDLLFIADCFRSHATNGGLYSFSTPCAAIWLSLISGWQTHSSSWFIRKHWNTTRSTRDKNAEVELTRRAVAYSWLCDYFVGLRLVSAQTNKNALCFRMFNQSSG